MANTARDGWLRTRGEHEHTKVTFVELFFDLVFVFAVTQISHTLLHDLTLHVAVETTLLLMAVWWVWIYTSWVTNWLDPETTPVRLMLFLLMLGGLVLSTSIPKAFGSMAIPFAVAYVSMQLGRSLFTLYAFRARPSSYRNFLRICSWLALAGVFWIAGALTDGQSRLGLWSAALLVEYIAPSARFWVPSLGRSSTTDWDVDGGHMAERCGLFVIIALGESILVTGAKFAELPWTPASAAAAMSAFLGSVAMWWIYFNIGAERASRRIAKLANPGALARLAYTYLHLPVVAGIIVCAVADELVLAHPEGYADAKTVMVLLSGPALYLLGNLLFKRATTAERTGLSHMVGLGLLVVLIPVAGLVSPLVLSGATTLILVVVATWETVSFSRGPAKTESGIEQPARAEQ